MKRHVYLAGPIAGCTYAEATDWREAVKAGLSEGILGISPMRLKEWYAKMHPDGGVDDYRGAAGHEEFLVTGESHAIRARDRFDVKHCDMVFAYLPKWANERRPSWGTTFEMAWADADGTPLVLVTEDESLIKHPLVRESVGWIVPSLELGVEVVNSVLGAYVE